MDRHSSEILQNSLSRKLDKEKLKKEISFSESSEKLVLVRRTRNYKLGIVVEKDRNGHLSYTLELLMSALHNTSEVDVVLLEKTSLTTRKLVSREYSLHHQGDGWILCEKPLEYSQIFSECSFLIEELE